MFSHKVRSRRELSYDGAEDKSILKKNVKMQTNHVYDHQNRKNSVKHVFRFYFVLITFFMNF